MTQRLTAVLAPIALATACFETEAPETEPLDLDGSVIGRDVERDTFPGALLEDRFGNDRVYRDRFSRGRGCATSHNVVVMTDPAGNWFQGCGPEAGLHVRPADANRFRRIPGFGDMRVYDLSSDEAGRIYVAGERMGVGPAIEVLEPAGSWFSTPIDLVDIDDEALMNVDIVGDVATTDRGRVLAVSADGSTLAWTDGEDWSAVSGWGPVGLAPGDRIWSLEAEGEHVWGVGETGAGRPAIWLARGTLAPTLRLEAIVFEEDDGWFNDISVGSHGIVAAGADIGADDGSLLVTCDQGCASPEGWTPARIAPMFSPPAELGQVYDVAFDLDGHYGIAVGVVGHPDEVDRPLRGFALLTRNGGATWFAWDRSLPAVLAAAVDVDGQFLLVGEDGYRARGDIASIDRTPSDTWRGDSPWRDDDEGNVDDGSDYPTSR